MSYSVVPKVDARRIRDLFDTQVRRSTASDGLSDVFSSPGIVRWSSTSDVGWSDISWTNLDVESADEAIRQQIEFFSALGKKFVWRVYEYDAPPDMRTRLERQGFTNTGVSHLMIARVQDLMNTVELPDGVSLVRANDERGIGWLIEVQEKVFRSDQSDLRRSLLAQFALSPLLNEVVVAVVDGQPVSSARVQFLPNTEFAGLWGGGTLPRWRRKGIYSAMVAHRAEVSAERGYNYLYVIASHQSQPILEHLAFGSYGSVSTFSWDPPNPSS